MHCRWYKRYERPALVLKVRRNPVKSHLPLRTYLLSSWLWLTRLKALVKSRNTTSTQRPKSVISKRRLNIAFAQENFVLSLYCFSWRALGQTILAHCHNKGFLWEERLRDIFGTRYNSDTFAFCCNIRLIKIVKGKEEVPNKKSLNISFINQIKSNFIKVLNKIIFTKFIINF